MSDSESVFTFVWKIESFSMLSHQVGEYLESPSFVIDWWKKVDFSLWLYPRGRGNEDLLGLYLCKLPVDLDLKINFTLTVESTLPTESKIGQTKDHVLQSGWGYPIFMKVSDIYAKKELFLPHDTLTVICEISSAEEATTALKSKSASMFLKNNCISRTCIQVQRRCIMWPVWNVKECMKKPGPASIILVRALKSSPRLKLTLNFNKIANDDNIPILINQTCLSSVDRLFVKCKITVTSTRKEHQTSKTSSHLFKKSISDVWRFPPFITTSMLMNEKYLNVDGMLVLRCEFAFSYKDYIHHSEYNYLPFTFETTPTTSELSTSLKHIYGTGEFCDIELRAGGKTFPYFKVVLCARSSVFGAMFENDMKEKASNVIEIEDVDPDTLQRMLTYMHSDVLQEDLSMEDACELYRVADKYDVDPLKNRLSVLLATTVSVTNVGDLLVLADTHMDNFLMTAATDFISSHTTEVFLSEQWGSFMKDNPKLSCSIMHKMWLGMYHI